jgi:hypothetical protein
MSLTSGWQLEVLENTARIARNDLPLPLYLQHEDRAVTSSGFEPIPFGEWLKFRAVPARDDIPGGLVALGRIFPGPMPWILRGMAERGEWSALSAGVLYNWPGPDQVVELTEISLIRRVGEQHDPHGLVLDTGERSLTAWELMTGQPADLDL